MGSRRVSGGLNARKNGGLARFPVCEQRSKREPVGGVTVYQSQAYPLIQDWIWKGREDWFPSKNGSNHQPSSLVISLNNRHLNDRSTLPAQGSDRALQTRHVALLAPRYSPRRYPGLQDAHQIVCHRHDWQTSKLYLLTCQEMGGKENKPIATVAAFVAKLGDSGEPLKYNPLVRSSTPAAHHGPPGSPG